MPRLPRALLPSSVLALAGWYSRQEATPVDRTPDSDLGRAAVTFATAMDRGEEAGSAAARLALELPTLFDGLDGITLRRALSIAP